MKTYNELNTIKDYNEKVKYLTTGNKVGDFTFNGSRILNQALYASKEWKDLRHEIIVRDNGCDLGLRERPISGKIIIHHINPISVEDIKKRDPKIFDPNNLVCVSHRTHNKIHYCDTREDVLTEETERKPNDTKLW